MSSLAAQPLTPTYPYPRPNPRKPKALTLTDPSADIHPQPFQTLAAPILAAYSPLIRATARRYGRSLSGTSDHADHYRYAEHLAFLTAWDLLSRGHGASACLALFPKAYDADIVDELRSLSAITVPHAARGSALAAEAEDRPLTTREASALAAHQTVSLAALTYDDGSPVDFADPLTLTPEDAVIERLERAERVRAVRAAVERLEPLARAVVWLRYLESEGRTDDDVRQRLGDDYYGWSAYGLGEPVNITRQRVQQVRQQALSTLRAELAHLAPSNQLDGGVMAA